MPFNLFHRKKQPEPEVPAPNVQESQPEPTVAPQESTQAPTNDTTSSETEQSPQTSPITTEQPKEDVPQESQLASIIEQKVVEQDEPRNKTYLKAMPLKELSDIENVKTEVTSGNIVILRITPLAGKSIDDVKTAVNDLFQFAESMGGDIARLGEERVVICPKNIRIWREKTPAPVPSSQPISTVA